MNIDMKASYWSAKNSYVQNFDVCYISLSLETILPKFLHCEPKPEPSYPYTLFILRMGRTILKKFKTKFRNFLFLNYGDKRYEISGTLVRK